MRSRISAYPEVVVRFPPYPRSDRNRVGPTGCRSCQGSLVEGDLCTPYFFTVLDLAPDHD